MTIHDQISAKCINYLLGSTSSDNIGKSIAIDAKVSDDVFPAKGISCWCSLLCLFLAKHTLCHTGEVFLYYQ